MYYYYYIFYRRRDGIPGNRLKRAAADVSEKMALLFEPKDHPEHGVHNAPLMMMAAPCAFRTAKKKRSTKRQGGKKS